MSDLTTQQTAKIFNVSRATIYDWSAKGRLKYYRLANSEYRFEAASVEKLHKAMVELKLKHTKRIYDEVSAGPTPREAVPTTAAPIAVTHPTLHDNWIALDPNEYPSAKLYAGMIVAFLENCEKLTLGEREATRGLLFPVRVH